MQRLPDPVKCMVMLLFTGMALQADAQTGNQPLPAGWRIFSNIEMVEYCLPLPLNEYAAPVNVQKGCYHFRLKANRKFNLQVQGLLRSDTATRIEKYFSNSYTEEDGAEGKIIQRKALIKQNNCFYAMGYMSNTIDTERFLEVTWLRKDDLVKLTVTFAVKDSTRWENRLRQLLRIDSFCH